MAYAYVGHLILNLNLEHFIWVLSTNLYPASDETKWMQLLELHLKPSFNDLIGFQFLKYNTMKLVPQNT